MLWLPTKQWRKVTAHLKRRRRRRRAARLLLFGGLIFGLTTASVPPEQALSVQVAEVTRPHQFDFVNWETEAVANEIGRQLSQLWHGKDYTDQQDVVRQFLEYEQQINDLERELRQLYATSETSPTEATELNDRLSSLHEERAAIITQVELILAQQVETILREEGFAISNQLLPPVTFRLIEPPTFLIISPREQIKRQQTLTLQPGLSVVDRATIEESLNGRGDVSSYVTNIGGLGSFPTMVISHDYLPYLIDIIIHEWTHNYLFTFPSNMAWSHQGHPRLQTINETTASLVGRELSRKVILRYYPEWEAHLPPLDETGQPRPAKPSPFHLAMRRIRQRVDQLLAAGNIEEAETFMEAERLKLVEQGYLLRQLNQAYFAFHGSYALSPSSVDPTGRELRQLRANSPSLKAFLNRVGWLNSYEDYQAWLAEHDIAITLKE